ncbi:uncharacterized protein Dvir_GJ21353 [Drosophila virilis]|uniref:TIL domain-containing protein n=1 Tax=Drosophila virilis TaxID=7244 RepID=B4LP93_DROVI|nr:uncharacterized protein LOC6625659 [Drosophila virilis]EDW60202.1 uncharacterized protein Dvir_GJ21353 [Drosophila virilis]
MWNWVIFVNLWLLLVLNASWAQRQVPCRNPIFKSCHHYCKENCPSEGADCVYNCESNCGCKPAYLMRNNGGCFKIRRCRIDYKSAEVFKMMPAPCKDEVKEPRLANGDDILNLLEFEPLDPHGK